jgi:hypothetical protein
MKEVIENTNQVSIQYLEKFKSGFSGILRWPQLDKLWQTIKNSNASWFVYQIGEEVPDKALSNDDFKIFIANLDSLIRKDHGEEYCGIVYVDDIEEPSFIKIYDPNNLGSSCGSSGGPPPLPGWTISLQQPCNLELAFPAPVNRKRWWKALFS